MGSILDALPHDGALFAGRTGAVPLPDGRCLLVTPESASVVDAAVEPPDNAIPAPDEALPTRRPAYLDAYPLFGGPDLEGGCSFADLWPRRDEPDGYVRRDPYTGGAIRVAQAFRAAASMGLAPAALSYQLRFGDPADPQAAYQLKAAIQGMADAAGMLQAPFVAGSLDLDPARGLDPDLEVRAWAPSPAASGEGWGEGTQVLVIGRMTNDLSGSLCLGDQPGFPPAIDLVAEGRVLEVVRAIGGGVPLARGGLLLALAQCCGRVQLGVRVSPPAAWQDLSTAAVYFGEAQSRFLVFLPPARVSALRELAGPLGVPVEELGTLGGRQLHIEGLINLKVEELR